jgi:hypothetical protein
MLAPFGPDVSPDAGGVTQAATHHIFIVRRTETGRLPQRWLPVGKAFLTATS